MPKFSRKRGRSRRKFGKKKKMTLTKKVAKLVRTVGHVERKHYLYAPTTTALGPSPGSIATITMSPLVQGVLPDQRIGNKVQFLNTRVRFRFYKHVASTESNQVRCLFVQRIVTDGGSTLPDIAQILSDDTSPDAGHAYPIMTSAITGVKRFRILKDIRIQLPYITTVGNNGYIPERNVQLKSYACHWDGAGQADNSKGQVYLMMFCDVVTDVPSVNVQYVSTYTDI